MKLKAFFIIFKSLSVAKNCLRPESAPLKSLMMLRMVEIFQRLACCMQKLKFFARKLRQR